MSHAIEIDEATGLAAFVAARETAWHRLGEFVPDHLLTIDEALDLAHMKGWDVRLVPSGGLLDPNDPLSWRAHPDQRAIVRNNPFNGEPEFLWKGQVSRHYQVWQNEQLGEFAAEIAGVFGDEHVVSAAGSMLNGAQVFLTLSLEGFTVLGDDKHDLWLTVMNGNDGNMSLTGFTGAIRVVCKNTADWAIGATTNRVVIRHSGDMIAKAGEAAALLGVARDWQTEYATMAEHLAGQKFSAKAFDAIVTRHFLTKPDKNASKRVLNRYDEDLAALRFNFHESPTTEIGRGTKWAALNAITEWAEYGRRGDQSTKQAARVNMFGTPAKVRAQAARVLAVR